MFESLIQMLVQFLTMVLSWFGMDAKALLGESFKGEQEQAEGEVAQHVATTLNEGEQ